MDIAQGKVAAQGLQKFDIDPGTAALIAQLRPNTTVRAGAAVKR